MPPVDWTGMRVIGYDDDGNEPCYNGVYANVEDYLVQLVAATLCTGTPNPGTLLHLHPQYVKEVRQI